MGTVPGSRRQRLVYASGGVTAWESEFFIPQGAATDVDLIAATLADMPTEHLLSPGGVLNDSAIGYKFPNIKTVCHRLETTPLRPALDPGSWPPGRTRSPTNASLTR